MNLRISPTLKYSAPMNMTRVQVKNNTLCLRSFHLGISSYSTGVIPPLALPQICLGLGGAEDCIPEALLPHSQGTVPSLTHRGGWKEGIRSVSHMCADRGELGLVLYPTNLPLFWGTVERDRGGSILLP